MMALSVREPMQLTCIDQPLCIQTDYRFDLRLEFPDAFYDPLPERDQGSVCVQRHHL